MFEVGVRVASIHHPNRADKSVPFSYHGLQEARFGRVIAPSCPDFSHHVVDVWFGIDKKIGAQSFVTMSLRETSCSLRLTMKISGSLGFFVFRGGEVRSARGRVRSLRSSV
jgi:hypothetical protein